MPEIEINTEHLARLARIQLTDKELAEVDPQLEDIVAYVSKLAGVDTADVSSSAYITDAINVFRQDVVEDCEADVRNRCLDAFPKRMGDALEVRGVFEERNE